MIVSSLCPWVSILGAIDLSGLQCRLGWATLLAGAGIVLVQQRPRWLADRAAWVLDRERLVCGLLATCAVVACLIILLGLGSVGPFMRANWGLYLSILASGAVIACLVGTRA